MDPAAAVIDASENGTGQQVHTDSTQGAYSPGLMASELERALIVTAILAQDTAQPEKPAQSTILVVDILSSRDSGGSVAFGALTPLHSFTMPNASSPL